MIMFVMNPTIAPRTIQAMMPGIIGAVVGGYLAGTVLGVADVTGINVESIVVAVIGGVLVVAAYRLLVGQRSSAQA